MKLYDVQPTYTKKEDSVSPYDNIQIERIAELEAELLNTQKELQYMKSLFINHQSIYEII